MELWTVVNTELPCFMFLPMHGFNVLYPSADPVSEHSDRHVHPYHRSTFQARAEG